MAINNAQSMLGDKTIVAQADLEDLQSAANRRGDTRKGGDSLGKRDDTKVLAKLTSDSSLKEVFALGSKSSDAWRVVDGSANITPVNLIDLSNAASGFTNSAGCTYTAGVLTADGVDNPTTLQTVALKAGRYAVSGTAACKGASSAAFIQAKLLVSGATDGTVLTKLFSGARYVTVNSELSAAAKEQIAETFTIAVDQNVTFNLSCVDQAGALGAGESFILLNLLEAA